MKEYQSVLFPYAYNILGSAEDAQDAIQDVVLKYTERGQEAENEKNYLIRGVINQSINLKKQKQRQQPINEWLPEPVSTATTDLGLELRELVSYSLLFLLERLSPKERAVFVLKEAFAYAHEEVAEVLSISVESSRQLFSRANRKIHQAETDHKIKKIPASHFKQLDLLTAAIREKDLDQLHQLFTNEIAYHADGGKKIRVVKTFETGAREVADLMLLVYQRYQRNYRPVPGLINHQPALLYYYRDKLMSCQVFEFTDDHKIKRISTVVDPEKLKVLARSEKI